MANCKNTLMIDLDFCGKKKINVGIGANRMPKMGKQRCEYKV
jgi:hypothetical protein